MRRAEYSVQYEDFVEAIKAYRRISRRTQISYYFCIWLWPAVSLLVGVLCFYTQMQEDGSLFGGLFWLAAACFGLAFAVPARYRMSVRRAFKQRDVLAKGKPIFCEFDEAKIRFVIPGGAEVSYPWDVFTDYFENDTVGVLFIKDAAFHTIPKRAMDETGWSEFRTYVNSRARSN